MSLTGVLPALGPFPQLHTFRCVDCRDVETRKAGTADRPVRTMTWFREAPGIRRVLA
jgi:hypothetical protein